MSVYNDLADDAGYPFGSYENEQVARYVEEQHMRQMRNWEEEEEQQQLREILFRRFGMRDEG